ncbi:Transcription factor hamlet [Porphyridium purpureum]|uniref:Transcription factor hamlet n=1 Tax=Porphyridium purpureum TaxID=35688 RepID=A0A5J4Z3M8_PORPP|nr:Transcription factor hamlet [Porphyridium purpureum]|eukprot:POR7935..scf295_1
MRKELLQLPLGQEHSVAYVVVTLPGHGSLPNATNARVEGGSYRLRKRKHELSGKRVTLVRAVVKVAAPRGSGVDTGGTVRCANAVEMASATLRTAERLLKIAESELVYEWLFGDGAGEELAKRMFGRARALCHDHDGFDSRMAHVPTQFELDASMVTDADLGTSFRPDLAAAHVPQGQVGRFVMGIFLSTKVFFPLKSGVTPWPAHRFVGFRMRNGYGYVCQGQDSEGVPISMLGRILASGKESLDQFYNLRYENGSVTFDLHASIESTFLPVQVSAEDDGRASSSSSQSQVDGMAAGARSPSLSSTRDLVESHLVLDEEALQVRAAGTFTDVQLAEPICWDAYSNFITAARKHIMKMNWPSFKLSVRSVAGDELLSLAGPSAVVSLLGRNYIHMSKLLAMYMDKISAVSSPRRSLRLGLEADQQIEEMDKREAVNKIGSCRKYFEVPHAFLETCSGAGHRLDPIWQSQGPAGAVSFTATVPKWKRNVESSIGRPVLGPVPEYALSSIPSWGPGSVNASIGGVSNESQGHAGGMGSASGAAPGASECELCGKHFSRRTELQRHVRTVHEGEKPFACKLCGKAFSQSPHLMSHIKTVHERRRDFQCETCDRRFSERSNLVKHVRRKAGRCVRPSSRATQH